MTRAFAAAKGFTLIELLITVTIVALLASVALPLAEVTSQRGREQDLRRSLREVREAIDAFKRASDDGVIDRPADRSGYPPTLAALVEGVADKRKPDAPKVFFLRRLPRDPLTGEDWALRSYASNHDDPQAGQDVYDIYSTSRGTGLNGIPYRNW
jgi:general secretion pathway protein G